MMELEYFDASIVARAKPIQTTSNEANQGAAISGGCMKDKSLLKIWVMMRRSRESIAT